MQFIFLSSLKGKENYLDSYILIIEALESLRQKVNADFVLKRDAIKISKKPVKDIQKDYLDIITAIRNSDGLIVEATETSTSMGHIISSALQRHIPVLVLYQKIQNSLVIGDDSNLLRIKIYEKNKEQLKTILRNFIKFVKRRKLDIRFNLMIDQEMQDKIAINALKLKISKADYIRHLITKDNI